MLFTPCLFVSAAANKQTIFCNFCTLNYVDLQYFCSFFSVRLFISNLWTYFPQYEFLRYVFNNHKCLLKGKRGRKKKQFDLHNIVHMKNKMYKWIYGNKFIFARIWRRILNIYLRFSAVMSILMQSLYKQVENILNLLIFFHLS